MVAMLADLFLNRPMAFFAKGEQQAWIEHIRVRGSKIEFSGDEDDIHGLLKKMISNFDINHQEKTNTPFFVINNTKEKEQI